MRRALTFILFAAFVLASSAQTRKVTPVESDDNRPPQPQLHFYDKHGEPLEEPVLFLAELDTVTGSKAKPVYPLFNGIDLGINFFDLVMKLTGQRHASVDLSAAVSLHNWIFPVAEVGVGFGSLKAGEDNAYNFSYTAKPSVYFKVGVNYNFLYKSSPDYQAYVGLRCCYSTFSYTVDDITISSGYWGQTNRFDLPEQRSRALYGELLAGIKVKLVGPLAMGWTGRYHFKFKVKDGENASPWFIPGYGTASPFSATLSVIYSF